MKRTILRRILNGLKYRAKKLFYDDLFTLYQLLGFHVIPNHYSQPIPDTRELRNSIWDRTSTLNYDSKNVLNMFLDNQKIIDECKHLNQNKTYNNTFYLSNGSFEWLDAYILYFLVRTLRPKKIIEIGSGFSTLLIGDAIKKIILKIINAIYTQ